MTNEMTAVEALWFRNVLEGIVWNGTEQGVQECAVVLMLLPQGCGNYTFTPLGF